MREIPLKGGVIFFSRRLKMAAMPNLRGILETVLYVDFFEAPAVYDRCSGSKRYRDQRLCAYDVGSRGVLLLFLRGHSWKPFKCPAARIPPHDGNGPVHIAFSIGADDLAGWEKRLGRSQSRRSKAAPNGPVAASAFISAIPTTISRIGDAGIMAGLLMPLPRECTNAGSGLAVNGYDRAAGDAVVWRDQEHDCRRNLFDLRPERKIGFRHGLGLLPCP